MNERGNCNFIVKKECCLASINQGLKRETNDRSAESGHAWKATWNRPMHLDEKSLDSLTVARMTDHNVRGSDEGPAAEIQSMRRDVGAQERYWRIGLGALLVIAALALPLAGVVRILLGILGVAGLVTGYSRYSAVNQMPRIDHFNDKIDQTEPKRDSSKAA